MKRPGVFLWLRYLFTSNLPDEYDAWVLHDTTCRTWLLRHTLRFLLFSAPVAVLIVLLLPAPLGLRLGCVVVGILGSAAISFGYTVEGAERRVEKAGYAYGTAERTRQLAADQKQRAVAAKNRARRAARGR